MPLRLPLRAVVFTLAFLSFACLLGQLFGFWSMHLFGCWVLPPATVLLAVMAWRARGERAGVGSAHTWIVQGALGGLAAAVAYDLYRLPFVLNGAPLFKVFPRFGQLLLGGDGPAWLVHTLGWSYHFSNGAALGIMFLALVTTANRRVLFWGAVMWALFIEAMLLLTPYPGFFGLPLDGRFIFLTATAHLIFGLTLGWWSAARSFRRRSCAECGRNLTQAPCPPHTVRSSPAVPFSSNSPRAWRSRLSSRAGCGRSRRMGWSITRRLALRAWRGAM